MFVKAVLVSVVYYTFILLAQCQEVGCGPPCCITKRIVLFESKHVQEGNITIGGIFSVSNFFYVKEKHFNFKSLAFCSLPSLNYYKYILVFRLAIDEINKNPNILPNVTLGYHIYDSCNDANKAIESVLNILSGAKASIPNYSCMDQYKLAGVIGDWSSEISMHIAQVLKLYGISQISYGAPYAALTDRRLYPSFFHTLPSDHTQFLAVVKLLKHFGWTWIGVIASDDEYGDSQTQELMFSAASHDICIEFIIKISTDVKDHIRNVRDRKAETVNNSTSQVIVLCGKSVFAIKYFIEVKIKSQNKTFIMPVTWVFDRFLQPHKTPYHGSILFTLPRQVIPQLKESLQNITTANCTNSFLLEHVLASYYYCSTTDSYFNRMYEDYWQIKLHKCNTTPNLWKDTTTFGTTYYVYKSVYAMAHSLHSMDFLLSRNSRNTLMKNQKLMQEVIVLHRILYLLYMVQYQSYIGTEPTVHGIILHFFRVGCYLLGYQPVIPLH
ncbi:vomeronasal type-2 receptor 1-like [Lithobates pipiens]